MLNELENKIRKAIPELMELGVGCEVLVFKHILSNELEKDIVIYLHKNKNFIILKRGIYQKDLIYQSLGKPIQLNHVLEYVMKQNNLLIKENILVNLFLSDLWNLKSNLLSDQSEELIKYLNEL